uniref:Uncharacterized protein n=1 Tax=Arabidopsis halleri TaxID=81970 RepID=B2WS72_ARAHA|nr:unknown [Arabidopsis halleri]
MDCAGKELTTRRLEPQLLEKEHRRVAFVKYYMTRLRYENGTALDPVVHRILTVHLGGGVIPVGPLDKLFVEWVYTFNGETESSTSLRPRGSPTSQLRHGVRFRSREMPPILAISQRMRSLKESKEVLDTESRPRLRGSSFSY